jgi:hypothetical protein
MLGILPPRRFPRKAFAVAGGVGGGDASFVSGDLKAAFLDCLKTSTEGGAVYAPLKSGRSWIQRRNRSLGTIGQPRPVLAARFG